MTLAEPGADRARTGTRAEEIDGGPGFLPWESGRELSATIVYNRTQHAELLRKGPADLAMFKGFAESIAAELAGVELVDPDLAYDGELRLDLGGRIALLREWGPAHTHGDQTILVDDRVLFSGDLAVTRMFPIVPYMMHGPHDTDADGNHWIEVLDQLLALAPQIVVPGHGEVTDATVLHEDRAYLAYIRDRVTNSGPTASRSTRRWHNSKRSPAPAGAPGTRASSSGQPSWPSTGASIKI